MRILLSLFIANLAQAQFNVKAKTEIDRLLALEPGATRASISTWGDETPNRTTASRHYVHFPRDTGIYIHQPLQAGYADDRGGNNYRIQAFGRGTHLHALWDPGLIESTGLVTATMTTKLMVTSVSAGDSQAAHGADPCSKP